MNLPFTVVSCSVLSEAQPASNLADRSNGGCWAADFPVQRATLRIDFGSDRIIERAVLASRTATHVEFRAAAAAPASDDFAAVKPSGQGPRALPRYQLVDPFRHKLRASAAISGSGSGSAAVGAVTATVTTADDDDGPTATAARLETRFLDVHVMCLWEPLLKPSLDHLEFAGSAATAHGGGHKTAAIAVAAPKVATALASDELFPVSFGSTSSHPHPTTTAPPPPPSLPTPTVAKGHHHHHHVSHDLSDPHSPPPPPPPPKAAAATFAPPSHSPPTPPKGHQHAPSSEGGAEAPIFSGLTIVLSGFQNPLRGEIRDKCVKLGAKVQADWGPGCTHLICVAPNTPKYLEVAKGKVGEIVSRQWLEDCCLGKRRLKEGPYRVGTYAPPPSDDDPPPVKKFRVVM